MIDESFRIYIEQLRNGKQAVLNEELSPDFLDVGDKDLSFTKPVSISGETYIAGDSLIIHLKINAVGHIPCSICNKPVDVDISIGNFYHAEPLEEIKSGIFDFREILREAILLEIPPFAECKNGKCPARKEIKKYLKTTEQSADEGYHPFADL